MRRIVFVNRYFYPDHSATSQMLTDLAFHLARAGWSVTVLTSRQRYDEPDAPLRSRETIEAVHVRRIWTTRLGRGKLPLRAVDYLTFYVSAFLGLLAVDLRGGIVIAKTDPPLISFIAAVVARLKDAILVNWFQDVFPDVAERLGAVSAGGILAGLARAARRYSSRRAALSVVVGDRMAEVLGPECKRVHVRHNWADGVAIHPQERSANTLRSRWGLTRSFVVGYSGNLGRAHDSATILEAIRILKDDRDAVFLMIGGGSGMEMVKEEVARDGLANVRFEPYQPKTLLGQSLTASDVHLVTLKGSLEGLVVPSKFYGILAAGRPIIFVGDPTGEIAALIRRHDCGLIVPGGEPTMLAEAIRRLKVDRALCGQMAGNARRAFDAHYAASLALADWQRVLESLTGPLRALP